MVREGEKMSGRGENNHSTFRRCHGRTPVSVKLKSASVVAVSLANRSPSKGRRAHVSPARRGAHLRLDHNPLSSRLRSAGR